MKHSKSKIIVLMVISYFIFGFFTQIFAFNGEKKHWVKLEGLELAKGIDIDETYRKGTIFAGQLIYKNSKIGYWTAILSHIGTENIEVCNGEGKIVSMYLTLNFKWGDQLVLGMKRGTRGVVKWNYNYIGVPCQLGGFDCETCGDINLSLDECSPGEPSDVAIVDDIDFAEKWGSTIKIKSAVLKDGRLCHYYPFIPRVSAWLLLTFK
jgi:hypothetical protein